jgi:hypothetical protein
MSRHTNYSCKTMMSCVMLVTFAITKSIMQLHSYKCNKKGHMCCNLLGVAMDVWNEGYICAKIQEG